jgi:hypothetical protein
MKSSTNLQVDKNESPNKLLLDFTLSRKLSAGRADRVAAACTRCPGTCSTQHDEKVLSVCPSILTRDL